MQFGREISKAPFYKYCPCTKIGGLEVRWTCKQSTILDAHAGTDALRNPGPVVRANSTRAGLLNRGRTLSIGYWDVRTSLDPGTQSLAARSLNQYNVDACCLSKARLPDSGSREIKIHGVESHSTPYHSGLRDFSDRHGVAIAPSQQADLALPDWEPVSDRMAYVRLKGHFTNNSIVSVYAPTSAVEQRDKEAFYSQLQALVEGLPRCDLLIVAGDWNGGTGPGDATNSHLGHFGLGPRCENGERRFQAVRDSRKRPSQAGFRAGRGCADQIFILRRILEFRHSYQQPTAVYFIDFAAAFYSVHRESLWWIMALDGVPAKIIATIKAYCPSTIARVLVCNDLSQPFGIRSGVRQGCILSPILFNYAIDWIPGRALHEGDGVEFAPGHRLTDLDYADDIALLASSFDDLQSMVSRVNEVAKSVSLSINAGKAKVFSICIPEQEKAPLGIDGCQLEEVDRFKYLRTRLLSIGQSKNDIVSRIDAAR
ncbi:hypothetical protein SprV_0301141600 [Sparganum proliferum]